MLCENYIIIKACLFVSKPTIYVTDTYLAVLKTAPSHTGALNNLGVCLALEGRHEEAISFFNRAVSDGGKNRDIASAYRNRAISLAYLKDIEAAERSLAQAEAIAPDAPETIIARGRLLWFKGEYSRSYTTHLSIQNRPDFSGVNPFLAISLLSLGDKDNAISILSDWLLKKPLYSECLSVISDIGFMKSSSPELETIANEAIDLFSEKLRCKEE